MSTSGVSLAVLTVVVLGFVLYQKSLMTPSVTAEVAGTETSEVLGSRRGRAKTSGCENVSIDSPDFARCATELGSGRTVLRGDPVNVAHNINTAFVNDNFSAVGAAKFRRQSRKTLQKVKQQNTANAFPFSESMSGPIKSTQGQLGSNALLFQTNGDELGAVAGHTEGTKFLGAAVSPSSLGASREEILQSTRVVVEPTVSSNTGGQLNLLHPLE